MTHADSVNLLKLPPASSNPMPPPSSPPSLVIIIIIISGGGQAGQASLSESPALHLTQMFTLQLKQSL